MRTLWLLLFVFGLSGAVSAQSSTVVRPFEKSQKSVYKQHLSIYVQEDMLLQSGTGIHGNVIFPFSAGVSYAGGPTLSTHYYEASLGWQLRRNRKFYQSQYLDLNVAYIHELSSLASRDFTPEFGIGLYCSYSLSQAVNHSYQEVVGLYEDCFNTFIIGAKASLRFRYKRFCLEEIFKVGTPGFNAFRMSKYSRNRVSVSIDYILALRLSYIMATNHR